MLKVTHSRHCDPVWDGWCTVLAKVVMRARRDALRGDPTAAAWLDVQAPGWRRWGAVRKDRPKNLIKPEIFEVAI